MSMSYPLADALTRIRNAQAVMLNAVTLPFSNLILQVLSVLKTEGYVAAVEVQNIRKGVKSIRVALKYFKNKKVIAHIKVISKPGLRVYSSTQNIPDFYNGLGTFILSTSKGILTKQEAVAQSVGGELLCAVF